MADLNSGAIVEGQTPTAPKKSNPTFQDALGAGNPYTSPAGVWPGLEKASRQWVYAAYQNQFGRPPTDNELAMALPAAQNGPDNALAYIASLAKGQTSSATAEPHYGDVDKAFQSVLGRGASQEEKDHFGSLLGNGDLDAYGLSNWLQQLPENVKKQDAEFRQGLDNDLQSSDARYYNEQVMPGIAQNYAKMGRSFDSSAYANALAQAATGQNRQRESFLSNLTASQYGGSQANARQDYMNNVARGYQTQDAQTGRFNQMQDFNIQKQAYDQYLKNYGKSNSWVNDLSTGLNMANSAANLFKGYGGGGGGGGGS